MNTGRAAPRSRTGLVTTIAWGLGGGVEYALEGSVFVAGAAVQWLRDGLGLIERAADSEAAARSVPDTGGVYLVPAFVGLGAPYWDERARGALVGLTRGTTRAHLVRAALEAIAYQTRDVVECIREDSGLALATLRVDGGACQNDFLMQFQADVLGAPGASARALLEVTAMGAALLAGLGVGFWKDAARAGRARRRRPQLRAAHARGAPGGALRGLEAGGRAVARLGGGLRPPRPLVIAHRGASGHLPENTLPAYQLAVAQGADMIEIDLHRTRDAAVVITHDEDLCGLGGRGEICDASLAEVRALDAGRGERVPLLDEVLDRFGPRIAFNLELKRGTRAEYAGVEAEALAAVRAARAAGAHALLVLLRPGAGAPARALERRAHRAAALAAARGAADRARPPAGRGGDQPLARARPPRADRGRPRRRARRLRLHGGRGRTRWSGCSRSGVDGLFTNYPDRMRALAFPAGG